MDYEDSDLDAYILYELIPAEGGREADRTAGFPFDITALAQAFPSSGTVPVNLEKWEAPSPVEMYILIAYTGNEVVLRRLETATGQIGEKYTLPQSMGYRFFAAGLSHGCRSTALPPVFCCR